MSRKEEESTLRRGVPTYKEEKSTLRRVVPLFSNVFNVSQDPQEASLSPITVNSVVHTGRHTRVVYTQGGI